MFFFFFFLQVHFLFSLLLPSLLHFSHSDIDNHPDIGPFIFFGTFNDAHSAVSDRFHLGPRSVPLAVKALALAHSLQREGAPVDPAEHAEFAGSEPLGGEGEEELVEEGEEEGVEVVARGGEAAVFFFCVCVFVESFFFFSSFPLFSLSPKKLEISLSLFSLSPKKKSKISSYRSSTAASPSRGVM